MLTVLEKIRCHSL